MPERPLLMPERSTLTPEGQTPRQTLRKTRVLERRRMQTTLTIQRGSAMLPIQCYWRQLGPPMTRR